MATRKSRPRSRTSGSQGGGNDTARAINESAQKIWLAGLGAFERARAEGPRMFDTLVEQGKSLGGQARDAADQALRTLKEQASGAGGRFDKLEQVFEDRVSRALGKLGVHTSADVERLSARVNELSEAVNALLKAQGIKRKAPGKGGRPAAKTASDKAGTAAKTAPAATGTAKKAGKSAEK